MTRIEESKIAKKIAEDAANFAKGVDPSQPHDSRAYYDKLGFNLTISDTYAGSYGSSSVYSWGDILCREFVNQIEIDKRLIIMRMAERLKVEAKYKREAAKAEASEILNGLSKEEV